MYLLDPQGHSRRAFLRRSAQLAMTGSALPVALNLAAMGEAAAFSAPSNDYKALVCVFLYGGNDYGNSLVPYDNASYDQYSAIRGGGAGRSAGGIALAQSDVAATLLHPVVAPQDVLGQSRQFALHPSMGGMAGLFNTGHAAVQLNVGPLIVPLTRAQYDSSDHSTYPRPAQLFSHNDQQSTWQSSSPEGSKVGWGGHIGDLAIANSLNRNSLFTCMSVTGNAVFLSGDTALQYQLSTQGAIKIAPASAAVYGSSSVSSAISSLVQQSRSHPLEDAYNAVTRRSMSAETAISGALGSATLTTVFPTDSLGQQLKMVARLIKSQAALGARRQVFMVSLGSFDLHDNLVRDHGGLLGSVSAGMTALYNATLEMGVANQVTAFTASDFGRTLASNGDGSDHGWGSHHWVVGGAVQGQRYYGTPPPVSVSDSRDSSGAYALANQWHVGQGRLLPSSAVDQYAATLARWFGVADSELPGILPNIGHFGSTGYPLNLGFLG